MESFSNFHASGSNEVDISSFNLQDYGFMQLDTETQNQQQSNLSSQNHNFAHSMAANTAYSLSNNMLPTPEGADRTICTESVIMSPLPFDMMSTPGLMVNGHYHSGDSLINSAQLSMKYMQDDMQDMPNLNLDMDLVSSPILSLSPPSNNSNDISPITPSSIMRQKRPSSSDNLINSMQLSMKYMQESMPNLNLDMSLISTTPSIHSLSPPSNSSNDISPITPSSIMRQKRPSSSTSSALSSKGQQQQRQQQNNNSNNNNNNNNIIIDSEKQISLQQQITNGQISRSKEQQRNKNDHHQFTNKSTKNKIFVASSSLPSPSQTNQIRNIMVTNNDGSPRSMMIISPNVSPISTGSTPVVAASTVIPGPVKKSIRNSTSPIALGPSIHPKSSPQALKPTISPSLKPKLPGALADEVAEQLANKSNYQNILEGKTQSLGISYPSDVHSSLETRRTTHKAAEQKRRDSLKQSFDELKKVIPLQLKFGNNNNNGNSSDASVDKNNNNSKSGENNNSTTTKNISKLFLLKRAHDHIVELQRENKVKDEMIQKLHDQIENLKNTKRQKTEIEKTEEAENNKCSKTLDREKDENEVVRLDDDKVENMEDIQDDQSNEKEETEDSDSE